MAEERPTLWDLFCARMEAARRLRCRVMTCCQEMAEQLDVREVCVTKGHADPWVCPDVPVVRMSDGRIGLPVRGGGRSALIIDYCPWCGARLVGDGEPG